MARPYDRQGCSRRHGRALQARRISACSGVLTVEEIAQHGAAVDEAVATRKQHDTRSLEEKTPYEQSFIQCQYIWEDFPGVRPLTFHPAIGQIAAALTGGDAVRLWHDQALYKEAGGRDTEAHT